MSQFNGSGIKQTIGILAAATGIGSAQAADEGLSGALPPAPPGLRQSVTNSTAAASAISANDALNYLSGRFGFIVVAGPALPERINFPTNAAMPQAAAVEQLNAELSKHDLAAFQDGRFLAVISSAEAAYHNQPVRVGRDHELVPPGPSIATHVIPLGYVSASELRQNLAVLLPASTVLSANEGANAVIVTGTEISIHRALLISDALDRGRISGSSIKVLGVKYADAKGLASVFSELFGGSSGQNDNVDLTASQGPGQNPFAQFAPVFQQQQVQQQPTDPSRAMPPLVAVADEHSNSVLFRGSPDQFPLIDSLARKLDVNVRGPTEIRLLRLRNADATEMAQLITGVFANPDLLASQDTGTGQRRLEQEQVIAVPDQRTSSVMVRASAQTIPEIAKLVRRLDSDPSGKQRLAVINVDHGDPSAITTVLQTLFGSTTASSATIRQSALEARAQQNSQSTLQAGNGLGLSAFGSGSRR